MNEDRNYTDEDYCDLSGSAEDDNGVVHYYDDDGFEVETFTPGWGC